MKALLGGLGRTAAVQSALSLVMDGVGTAEDAVQSEFAVRLATLGEGGGTLGEIGG